MWKSIMEILHLTNIYRVIIINLTNDNLNSKIIFKNPINQKGIPFYATDDKRLSNARLYPGGNLDAGQFPPL